MATSDYGSTLTKGAASIGKCKIVDFPEIATGKINSTNHASGGVAESIPDGLITLGDITVDLICETGTLAGIYADIESKSVETIVVANDVDSMSFDGYYLSVKEKGADAERPDLVKATVKIACTGEITINGGS